MSEPGRLQKDLDKAMQQMQPDGSVVSPEMLELRTLRTLAAELARALNTVVNAYEGQTWGTPYEMTRALPDARAALAKARAAGLVP